MAVVTTYGLVDFDMRRQPPPQEASGLDAPFFSDQSYPNRWPILDTEALGKVDVTNNLPIDLEPKTASVAWRMPTFLDDYYFRVHVKPGVIALGNLLSSQIRTVEVWSAHLSSKLLSSIGQVGTEGITFTQPVVPPTYFAALESRTYTINISTNGPPIVDAVYSFHFPSETPTLTVTGRRVVLWPFVPDTGYDETMEWKTDLLDSFNNEQRLALREAPRQSFSHKFLLDEQQFSRAKAISTQWAHRVYGIAVWDEVTPLLNGLTAGSSFIAFDTANADYRDDDLIMLWASDTNLAALEITTVTPTGVNLKLPLDKSWPKCYIAPLRFARTLSGVEYSRAANKYITAKAQFLVTQNKDLGDNGTFPTYRGKPVMTDRSAVVGDLSEKIVRNDRHVRQWLGAHPN
ncbi:hypothetical protein P6F33_gp07 [Pseudomonas phage Quinobequin-P09]|uniref:Virion structural protein n=1 Tax=Pseudomonas phage Quinobequin-P09 TaxID=2660687 RepID=A0A5P8PQP3_9CAUD|nr:hypothetical protein P6F33_gp07 [Pseudomonas phage Quinobequin-P09]QFR59608.1 hypothetical protein QuinobequinP09_55 [Pseudomonas phage Quinobequin-P09]